MFFALGVRRAVSSPSAVAYGDNQPAFWIVARGRTPAPSYGHVALRATGRAAVDAVHAAGLAYGGTDDGAPGPRAQYARPTTPATSATRTACASRSSPARADPATVSLNPPIPRLPLPETAAATTTSP